MRARDAAFCGSHEKTLTERVSYAFEAEKNLYVTPPPPLVQGVCTTVCV